MTSAVDTAGLSPGWAGYDEPAVELEDDTWARSPVEIRIRPAFGITCSVHGTVGHAADYDAAKRKRDRHWQDEHAPRIPAAGGGVDISNPSN